MPSAQVAGFLAVVGGLVLGAAAPFAMRNSPAAPAGSRQIADGKRLFEGHCGTCHGLNGQGSRGPDLTNPAVRSGRNPGNLFRTISNGIPGTEMPRARLHEQEIWKVIAYLDTLIQAEPEPLAGDFQRGKALYYGRGGCYRCHWLNGSGGRSGPELSAIGRSRAASHLRQSLVDPGADLPPGYQTVSAVLSDGSTIEGLRLSEDPFTIQLRGYDDDLHSLDKSSLRSLARTADESSMPSYADTFNAAELEDVVAFLAALPQEDAGQ